MTNRRKRLLQLSSAATACLVFAVGLTGCGSSTPPPQVVAAPPPPPPPPPPQPKITPIDQLMVQLGIDERVRLPEDKAPGTDEERRAVLEFFDALARGDAAVLGTMLSMLDRAELDELVQAGAWQAATSQITRVQVETGESPDGQACALAICFVGDSFQPQLWYYTADVDGAIFNAVATPPGIMDKLSGSDWIASWFDVIEEEMAMADRSEEEFVVPQKDLSKRRSSGTRTTSTSPTAPPGPPGKRPKPKNPRRPPGPPG